MSFLVGFLIIPALIGLLFIVQVFILPKKPPMDSSNRINHLRLVWFALKSPQKFVGLHYAVDRIYPSNPEPYTKYRAAFPWLSGDEGDNVDGAI